jgi:hypothetical protein
MAQDKEEPRGFQVKDRRRFSDTGEARPEATDAADAPPSPSAPPPSSASAPIPEVPQASVPPPPEEATFSTFVLGLSTQALLHLGEIPNPVTQAVEPDLEAARQVIDILGVLRDKTRNNLEPGEQALLDSALYDLRMRYVELVRRGV